MTTSLTWHGHSAWQLDTAGICVQIDPFLTGNPAATAKAAAIAADFILVSHGHGDHVGDTVAVAQRTGATTYHIELVPAAQPDGAGRPILALAPGTGDVDLVVASELMEAGRAIAGGYTAPDRTMAIASTSRSYLVVEKIAMSDGRYDPQRLIAAVEKNSRQALLLDFEAVARQANAMINAVLLGAIAGARALPIPAEAFEAAIRADGKAVEANLRGFAAGLAAARECAPAAACREAKTHAAKTEGLADLGASARLVSEFCGLAWQHAVSEFIDKKPLSRTTVSAPEPDKWRRRHGSEIERVLPAVASVMERFGYSATSY